MIFFFVFILCLTIYEIYSIVKEKRSDTKLQIIIYLCMTVVVIAIAVYYYLFRFENSFTYYIFKIFNIHY